MKPPMTMRTLRYFVSRSSRPRRRPCWTTMRSPTITPVATSTPNRWIGTLKIGRSNRWPLKYGIIPASPPGGLLAAKLQHDVSLAVSVVAGTDHRAGFDVREAERQRLGLERRELVRRREACHWQVLG